MVREDFLNQIFTRLEIPLMRVEEFNDFLEIPMIRDYDKLSFAIHSLIASN